MNIKKEYTLGYLPECSITQSDKFCCFHFNLLSYKGYSSLLLEHSGRWSSAVRKIMNKIYNIGQILTAQKDIEIERCLESLGTKDSIKKGTKIFIGADNLAHYKDGTIQPLGENAEVKGYSVSGLADFIWLYIRNYTPIDEKVLEEYDETPDCVKSAIMDAFEELGMYDHTGNRS